MFVQRVTERRSKIRLSKQEKFSQRQKCPVQHSILQHDQQSMQDTVLEPTTLEYVLATEGTDIAQERTRTVASPNEMIHRISSH